MSLLASTLVQAAVSLTRGIVKLECIKISSSKYPACEMIIGITLAGISSVIILRVVLVICFESMHAIGHVGSQNRQI